jgi:hypothetical protein
MTGTEAFELSDAELQGLRRFVRQGGLLIADAAGSSRGFAESLEKYLGEVFSGVPRSIPDKAPLLTGAGIPGAVSLEGVQYRRAARRAGGGSAWPQLLAYSRGKRYAAIFSRLDLSAGLLGTDIYELRGYTSESAAMIMRNLLLYGNMSMAEKAAVHPDR